MASMCADNVTPIHSTICIPAIKDNTGHGFKVGHSSACLVPVIYFVSAFSRYTADLTRVPATCQIQLLDRGILGFTAYCKLALMLGIVVACRDALRV